MASERKKRQRPVPTSSQRSKKRQKIIRTTPSSTIGPKNIITLDAMPWNEVEVPEMFDDVEGFFGLEEVDDIEVIRDGDKIQFLSGKVESYVDEKEFESFAEDNDLITEARIKSGTTKTIKPKHEKKISKKQLELIAKNDKNKSKGLDENIFAALLDDDEEKEVDISAWEEMDLSAKSLSAIAKLRFAKPTPIQKAAIPEILAGHDVIGKASTGSGKTLAFGVPILEKWLEASHSRLATEATEKTKIPTALIISPTRELAHQICEHLTKLSASLPDAPYTVTVTGGLSVQKQQRQLLKADIVIGTPGRLWEVMSTSVQLSKAFKQIKFLVIDEADRLLIEGHFKEAAHILNAIDRQVDGDEDPVPNHQTLVFSATFHKGLQQKLAGRGKQGLMDNSESMEYLLKKLNFREEKPKFIDVNPISQMAEGLQEGMVECAGPEKDLFLYSLLLYHPNQRTLVFTNSIHSVRRLTPLLQNLNVPALALHSQMPQKARLRSIERFSSPNSPSSILVATDVAARGLDIAGVQLVIHYHLPRTADMYVHRSGRTARASLNGASILLCCPEEVVPTRRLIAKVHAQNAAKSITKTKYYMRSLDLDRKVIARLKPRVTLAKRIADSAIAKEKRGHEDDWLKNAAEELGVDYDSEEFEAAGGGRKGRGTGRRMKENEARALSKAEIAALKAELKQLLTTRVNVGVSEKYLTASGEVDIDELLKGTRGDFLGKLGGIGMQD